MQHKLTTLENGLRVVTAQRENTETVSLGIWVNTGSAYEPQDLNGISHFIEHMVFKGSKKRNSVQISEEIENVGGQNNAYTSREFTAFYAKMLKNDVELALDVIADFVLHPTFPDDEMVKEKEVVIQEIKQSIDTPDDVVFDYFQETAFPNQPLGRTILGPKETVRSFNADMLHSYMHNHYAANNTVVVAVGNIKHENFVEMVKARMANYQKQSVFEIAPQVYQGGFYQETRQIEQAHMLIGFKGVEYTNPLYYPINIFSTIFGGGMSSRLFQEIREKRGLVYSVYSYHSSQTSTGLFGIYAGTSADQLNTLLPVVSDEIKKVLNEYVTDKELNRAKVQLKASMLMALESSSSTAEVIARQMLLHGRVIPTDEVIAKIDNVSKDDILKAAQYFFSSTPTYTLLGDLKQYPDYEKLKQYLPRI
ncbi:MAG: insulinase family protein [Alphaproteobacteria bacterium]|nr:insulinase family protein [Alphaproteobacteria bacterium]